MTNEKLAEQITQILEDANLIQLQSHEEAHSLIRMLLPVTEEEIDEACKHVQTPSGPSMLKELREFLGMEKTPLRVVLKAATDAAKECHLEKERRIYYQSIVYDVCNCLDKINGGRIRCGTAESPCSNVQKAMDELVERLKK